MDALSSRRDELRKYVKRSIPQENRDAAKEKIKEITSELRKLRHEKHLCEDIREKSADLDTRIRTIEEERSPRMIRLNYER